MTQERESERSGRNRPSSAAGRRGRQPSGDATEAGKGRPTPSRTDRVTRAPLPSRLLRFLREVVAELRKVIWPTRKELVTYTIVVLVFVAFMVALIALFDLVFARGVLYVFG